MRGFPTQVNKIITIGEDGIEYKNTFWDDLRFPFIGRRLDVASGRIDYNYTELGVDFADNARYAATEQISIICQFAHKWKLESDIEPHIHWVQNQSNLPNMLMEYRIYKNGDAIPGVWTKAISTPLLPYTSGSILQISEFPTISMSGVDSVSAFMDIKFFRDTLNASGSFAGADPYTGTLLTKELDLHIQIDRPGSRTEYTK